MNIKSSIACGACQVELGLASRGAVAMTVTGLINYQNAQNDRWIVLLLIFEADFFSHLISCLLLWQSLNLILMDAFTSEGITLFALLFAEMEVATKVEGSKNFEPSSSLVPTNSFRKATAELIGLTAR